VDKLGVPQYGGEITIRAGRNIVNFDPYFTEGLTNIYGAWLERLVTDDWTTDPDVWNYQIAWHPSKYQKGNLAESWEFPDPTTHVIHLRKGFGGKSCRRPTAVNLPLKTSCFITTGFTASEADLRNPAPTATLTCACRI